MKNKIERHVPFEKQFRWLLLFGFIWGLLELLLTPLVKSIIPEFAAIIVPLIIVIYVLIVKYNLPTPGTVLLMAIIAATMKFLAAELVLTGAFMAILLEAVIIELVFLIFSYQFIGYLVAGISLELYNVLHPVLSRGYFFQSHQFIIFKRWLAGILGYEFAGNLSQVTTTAVLLLLHLAVGILAGWLAWRGVNYIFGRGQTRPSASQPSDANNVARKSELS